VLRKNSIKPWRSFLPPLFLGVLLFAAYLRTLAPGLTWANGGSDGGDLIAAAATGGIPHPTGYPLYLLLARLFQLLPVGSLAYRTNLMSALFTVAASLLIYVIVVGQLSRAQAMHRMPAGLAAGICFGLSPLAWSQAVITEVYALQAFLVVLLLYLYTTAEATSFNRKALDGVRGLALGLALANHLTALLLVPLFLLVGTLRPMETEEHPAGRWRAVLSYRISPAGLGIQLLGLVLGVSLYLTLPLRARMHPEVNWGNPVTFDRLWWLVSGKLYQSYYLQFDFSRILPQVQAVAQFSVLQLGLLGIFLALLGLVVFGRLSRLFILTAGLAVAALAFSFVYHPADANVYLLPLLISFSIWLGLGVGELAALVSKRSPALAMGLSLLILGLVLIRSLSHFQQMDASQDSRAEDFARQVLTDAPREAILFAEGDGAIFALWYFHYALHERPDLVVIAKDLVTYDWYQETLKATYPTLSLPGPIVFPETIARANPNRPVCQVKYSGQVEMECTTIQ
jgi:hypothetical protein